MANSWVYTSAKDKLGNWASAGLKVMLLTASYTYNIDHDFVSDVNFFEVSGTGYTGGYGGSGRKTLASPVRTVDDTNNIIKYTGNNLTWSSVTLTNVRYAAIIKEVGGLESSSELWALVDFLTNRSPVAQDLVITWDAVNGIINAKED